MNPLKPESSERPGVELTQLGFGSAPLGELFVRARRSDGRRHTAKRRGTPAFVTTIPLPITAGVWPRFVAVVSSTRSRGPNLFSSSKVGRWFFPPAKPHEFQTEPWAGGLHFDHVHDYSYDGIMRSYEQSQMRLGMNRIDLLLIHDLDFWFHADRSEGFGLSQPALHLRLAGAR